MYRIMLADDEGIVIDSLKFIIEKEFGRECEVEYAKTGRSVIELAETFRPDIAIMDIQMPGINGIDAMKEIREKNRDVIFIVMSAYDKFDYATEAIKLGVLDYITKPMDKKRIVTVLQRAMEIIAQERSRRSNDLLVKEKLETVVPIIESGLIYNVLLQEHFTEDIENYTTILGIHQKYGYMIAVVCGDRQEGNHMTNAVGSSVRLQSHYHELREYAKEYFGGIVGTIMANKLAVLVPYDTAEMNYDERNLLIEKARELARKLHNKIGISFRIGIGGTKELQYMSESYSEALQALIHTTGSVAHGDDLSIRCDYADDYPVDTEKRLFSQIEKGDYHSAVSTATIFFSWMEENYPDSLMDIRLKVLEFVLWAEHLAYDKGGMTYRFKVRQDYLPDLLKMQQPEEVKGWFLEKITDACRNILGKRTEKSTNMIEIAQQYIRSNYARDLSLDEVSRQLNISSYYFSKVFKEGTGENFVEYLNKVRIESAKKLLLESDYSIKSICAMIGYADPNYFSRSFKKYVGTTPTEFKEGKE